MPDNPAPISQHENVPGQPYDAASVAPMGKWKSVDPEAGSVSFDTGKSSGSHFGDTPDAGEGGWKQT